MNALEKLREKQHELSAGINVIELADKYICKFLDGPSEVIDSEWFAVCKELHHIKTVLNDDPENEELGKRAEKMYESLVSFLREKEKEEG